MKIYEGGKWKELGAGADMTVKDHGSVSGNVTLNYTDGQMHFVNCSGPVTLNLAGFTPGVFQVMDLVITSNGYPVTWPSGAWADDYVPTFLQKGSVHVQFSSEYLNVSGSLMRTSEEYGQPRSSIEFGGIQFAIILGNTSGQPSIAVLGNDVSLYPVINLGGGNVGAPKIASNKQGVWMAAIGSTTIRRSLDGGLTWSNITVTGSTVWDRIIYGNGVWMLLESNGKWAKSTDNGDTWTSGTFAASGMPAYDNITLGQNGTLIGWNQGIKRSINNGASWTNVDNVGWSFASFATDGQGNWLASGLNNPTGGSTAWSRYSTDDGATWTAAFQNSAAGSTFSCNYVRGKWLLACGGSTLYKSTQVNTGFASSGYSSSILGPGVGATSSGVWLTAAGYVSLDDGATFKLGIISAPNGLVPGF